MSIFRTDNDKRAKRLAQLDGLITALDSSMRNDVERMNQNGIQLSENLSKLPHPSSDVVLPSDLPSHWIPRLGAPTYIQGKGTLFAWLEWGARMYGGYLGFSVSAPLLRGWVASAVRMSTIVQLTRNLAPGQAFAFTAAEVAAAEGQLGWWARIGGWRGVVRFGLRGTAGALVGVVFGLAVDAYFDETEYDQLIKLIKDGAKARYIAAVEARQIKKIADAIGDALTTSNVYLRLIANGKSLTGDDVREDIFVPLITAIANAQKNIEDGVYQENFKSDSALDSYLNDDPSENECRDALQKHQKVETETSAKLAKIKISSGYVVDSLTCEDASGKQGTKWGGTGGSGAEFLLGSDEEITSVSWQPVKFQDKNAVTNLTIYTTKQEKSFGNPSVGSVTNIGNKIVVTVPKGWRVTDIIGGNKLSVTADQDGEIKTSSPPFVEDIYLVGELSS